MTGDMTQCRPILEFVLLGFHGSGSLLSHLSRPAVQSPLAKNTLDGAM